MPALDEATVSDLTKRVHRYLSSKNGYSDIKYRASGGSAAIFVVATGSGFRVIKALNPAFFGRPSAAAERKRLDLQRKLIGHGCASLVRTFQVEEAEGTAFAEMEFVDWPQLKDVLTDVPDDAIVPLFTQLVGAVKFLDALGIIHRDIKPENVHVSPDFTQLKLLDLGVAREIEQNDTTDAIITDHGSLRPFLATAQYSSPEYLFRLDEPSSKLWKGLNFYQLGAVLHDLVMKETLFQKEMSLGNRWLVARAVLTQVPSFADGNSGRLANLKALASRCLVKDLDARLQLVSWEDFILEGAKDPLTILAARLAKGKVSVGGQMSAASASRLDFDRSEFFRRFSEMVRTELLSVCGTNMPLTLCLSNPGKPQVAHLRLAVDGQSTVECKLCFHWQAQLYERTAKIMFSGQLIRTEQEPTGGQASSKLVVVANIAENEAEAAAQVAAAIAVAVTNALDRLEGAPDAAELNDTDLLTLTSSGESE